MKIMQLKMLTILLRWNNMKYSLDNTAYVINDSNCGRLNQIYRKYWKPNGYQFRSKEDLCDVYNHHKQSLTKYPIVVVYSIYDECLYLGYEPFYSVHQIKDVNNLITVE